MAMLGKLAAETRAAIGRELRLMYGDIVAEQKGLLKSCAGWMRPRKTSHQPKKIDQATSENVIALKTTNKPWSQAQDPIAAH